MKLILERWNQFLNEGDLNEPEWGSEAWKLKEPMYELFYGEYPYKESKPSEGFAYIKKKRGDFIKKYGRAEYAKMKREFQESLKSGNYPALMRRKLKPTEGRTQGGLRNMDLAGLDISGADLSKVDFYRCSLVGTNLQGCTLKQLNGCNLNNANLSMADFTKSEEAAIIVNCFGDNVNVRGANMSNVKMKDNDFQSANMQGTYLMGANIQGGKLEKSNLEGAVLMGATISGVSLNGSSLQGAKMIGANLEGADLSGANLEGATYDVNTKLPEGANPKALGMVKKKGPGRSWPRRHLPTFYKAARRIGLNEDKQ